MEINNNKCATCAHNFDKSGLDCEFHCVEATATRTASDGTVYIISCGDYLKDSATYSVT